MNSGEPRKGEARLNDLRQEMQAHWLKAPAEFFQAWKRGVRIAGAYYFGDGTEERVERASEKWDLEPRSAAIRDAFGVLSSGERTFLAAMYSFYNAHDGAVLLKECGFEGLADLSTLDLPRRKVIADLLLNYTGW